MENGIADNSFEACLSQVESRLPKTFRALEDAATRRHTILEGEVYANLCRYSTMVKLSSPAAKAKAVVDLVMQINMEVESGQRCLLRDLGVPNGLIAQWSHERSLDRRVILHCDNPAQFAFRFQYNRTCDDTYAQFLRCNWNIVVPPFDLLVSDVGIIPICFNRLKVIQYLLPISPRLLLIGVWHFEQERNSREPEIRSQDLPADEAEFYFEAICLSAVSELIATSANPKVPEILATRHNPNAEVEFCQIANPALITSSGRLNSAGDYILRTVSIEEYVKYLHSFVTPPQK